MAQIVRIPGGYAVDGLEFRRGKCGCSGMGGDCCYTYSKVKQEGNTLKYPELRSTSTDTGFALMPNTAADWTLNNMSPEPSPGPASIPRGWRAGTRTSRFTLPNAHHPWMSEHFCEHSGMPLVFSHRLEVGDSARHGQDVEKG